MKTTRRSAALILALGLALVTPSVSHAQFVIVQSPAYYPVVPVTSYYAPPVAYPVVQPALSYSYYPPVTTSYSVAVPTAVYSPAFAAPVVAPAGYVTTRTYYGYGILRPRGVYTQSFFTP